MLHFIRCCIMGWNHSSVFPQMLLQWKGYVLTGFYVMLSSGATELLITICHCDRHCCRNSITVYIYPSYFHAYQYYIDLCYFAFVYILCIIMHLTPKTSSVKMFKVFFLLEQAYICTSDVLFLMTAKHCFDFSVVKMVINICLWQKEKERIFFQCETGEA